MTPSDRLIEYYFQRKIKGMSDNEIERSLDEQFMEDNERELIIKQVQFLESRYKRSVALKRTGRNVAWLGLGFLISSAIVYGITEINGPFPQSEILIYSLASVGLLSSVSGWILSRKS